MRSCCIVAAILFVGCAKAGAPGGGGGGGGDQVDAGFGGGTQDASHGIVRPDAEPGIDAARPIDAAPIPDARPGVQQVTLSQTTKTDLVADNAVACPATHAGTAANQYYRIFDLATLGITSDFTVNTVSFQVEDCESLDGDGTSVSVRVGTYTGTIGTTLQANAIAIAQSVTAQVPEVDEDFDGDTTPGGTVNQPITATIAAGSKLIIEVDAPDGDEEDQFYIGTNGEGQSAAGFVSSPRCSPPGTTPTDVNTLNTGFTDDLLMTVTGTYQP
jgi:hypothetical protein|nr:hypothetical protein [Kofleriaceae bacterium]